MKTQDSVRVLRKAVNGAQYMATRYRFGDNSKPHFITFSVVNWKDIFEMLGATA